MEKAFRIARDFTHDTEEAKDLSQDAFLRAFSKLKQFDGRSSFYTWFYRLLVNLCLDHVRRRGRVVWERLEREAEDGSQTVELSDTSSKPEDEAMAGEAKRCVQQTLQAMPKNQRTAFLLRNDKGLPIPEIAKAMKTTEGTVRVYLHRAAAALRQSLVEFV
jgi:RNA polymerase sigma-70 factor (ECF subfamily)